MMNMVVKNSIIISKNSTHSITKSYQCVPFGWNFSRASVRRKFHFSTLFWF